MKKSNPYIEKGKHFIKDGLWDINPETLSKPKRLGLNTIKIVIIVIKGFFKNNCNLQASALTNICLMSMVPILAFCFSIAKAAANLDQELKKNFDAKITDWLSEQGPGIKDAGEQLFKLVADVNPGAIGIVGFIMIIFTIIGTLSKVEITFNGIWGVHKPREFFTRVKEYFLIAVILPLALIGTSALKVTLSSDRIVSKLSALGPLQDIYTLVIGLFGYAVLIVAFTYLYKFMPNTKVKFCPALLAAVITAAIWSGVQWAFITFQIGVANANAIYGTFSSIPLFLAWLYTAWLVILFGCELSFGIQNLSTYEDENRSRHTSFLTLRETAFLIMRDVAIAHFNGESWTRANFVHKHQIPTRVCGDIIESLCAAKILKQTVPENNSSYAPGRDISRIQLLDILNAIRGQRGDFLNDKELNNDDRKALDKLHKEHLDMSDTSLGKVSLKDFAGCNEV